MRSESVMTKLNKNTFEQSDLKLLGTACRTTIHLQLGFYSSHKCSNTHANWSSCPSSSYKRVNTSCSHSLNETYNGWINREWGKPNAKIWTGDTNATWDEGQLNNMQEDGTVDWQGTRFRRNYEVPFVLGKFRKTTHNPVANLGFLRSTFVSKVRGWNDSGGALDDDVAIITRDNLPLKELVSDK